MKPETTQRQAASFNRAAWAGLLIVILLRFTAVDAQAGQLVSAVTAGGGGVATANACGLTDTVGQPCVGQATSINYLIRDGFWNDINTPPVAGVPPTLELTSDSGEISLAALLATVSDADGDNLTLFSLDSITELGGIVGLNNGWVSYHAPPGFPGTDNIRFSVVDSDGNLISSLVMVIRNNPGPVIESVADQVAYVLLPLVLTNHATDLDLPIAFNLTAGAPPNAYINPSNGVFRWTPARDQARSVNVISVVVTDSGTPAASSTNSFTVVVEDFVEVSLGRMTVETGRTNTVPVSLASSTGLTNLQVSFRAAEDSVVALTMTDWAPGVGNAALQHESPDVWRLEFSAIPGQVLPTDQLARISFLATASHSAFAPLACSEVVNLDEAGLSVWRTIANDGRVVVVAAEPLLEALPLVNNLPNLLLYGNPGSTYEVLLANELTANSWLPVWQGDMASNCVLSITSLTNSAPTMFFRARTIWVP